MIYRILIQSSGNNTNGAVSKPDILKIDREAEHLKKVQPLVYCLVKNPVSATNTARNPMGATQTEPFIINRYNQKSLYVVIDN